MTEMQVGNGFLPHYKPFFHPEPMDKYTIVRPAELGLGSIEITAHRQNSNETVIQCAHEKHAASGMLLRKTWLESPSITGSYVSEWRRLFGEVDVLQSNQSHSIQADLLRENALNGQLRNCRFRSICWRVQLGILPVDMRHWNMAITRQRRRFQEINYEFNLDPHIANAKDHPLSGDQPSRWCRYFNTKETKRMIAQDVDRTFPDIEYFRDPNVQKSMVNVLYCYVKHTASSYKQGMHEILAPLFFVLHCDQTAFQHACETNSIPVSLKTYLTTLLNERYLEADAFVLFNRIMANVQLWYANDPLPSTNPRFSKTNPVNPCEMPKLFTEAKDVNMCATPGVAYVEEIHNKILLKYNQKLYFHLKQLDIIPALFGLRWIRLLFGHEFPLQDVLFLWDCIFAIEDNFALVSYIYVSMLDILSPKLLSMGYSDCMSTLMRYPPGVDVSYLLQMALHFYNPKQYALPAVPIDSSQPGTPNVTNDKIATPRRRRRFSLVGQNKVSRSGSFAALNMIPTTGRVADRPSSLIQRNPLLDIQIFPRLRREFEISKSTLSLNRIFGRDQSGLSTPNVDNRLNGVLQTGQRLCSREMHRRCYEMVGTCLNHISSVVNELETEMCNQSKRDYRSSTNPSHTTNDEIRRTQVKRLHVVQTELEKVEQWLDDEHKTFQIHQAENDASEVQPIRRADSLTDIALPLLWRAKSVLASNSSAINHESDVVQPSSSSTSRTHTSVAPKIAPESVVRMKLIRKRELPTAPSLQQNALHTPLHILVSSA